MAKKVNLIINKNYLSKDDKERIITEICNNVIENKISFNKAVDESDINNVDFYKWISKDIDLQTLYNYARIVRSDILFEEIIQIADNQEDGEEVTSEYDNNGNEIKKLVKKCDLLRQRQLKIDARKWVVAKMQPKKYGDKLDITSDGEKLKSDIPAISLKIDGKDIELK